MAIVANKLNQSQTTRRIAHGDACRSEPLMTRGTGVDGATPTEMLRADIRVFLNMLYGGGTGFCHVVYGEGWYRTQKGKLAQQFWSESRGRLAYAYPQDTDAIIAKILELSTRRADVYVATGLMKTTTSRNKDNLVNEFWCLHADVDNENLNLDKVAELGWAAVSSGSPGHYHVYIPLSEPVSLEVFEILQARLIELLNADAKKAGNDVLRPPATFNFKATADVC